MEQLNANELLLKCSQNLKGLALNQQIYFIAQLMLVVSLSHLVTSEEPLPKNWDEAFLFLTNKKKKEGESIAVALGLQAITINMWLLTEKK